MNDPRPAADRRAITTQPAQLDNSAAKWTRTGRWLLALLVLAAIGVRSLDVTRPLVGQFATKNVVYAMIARNLARGEAESIWRPTVDVVKAGHKSWHLLEVPLTAYVAGWGWQQFGGSLDAWGRGVSIVCSGLSVLLLFALVRRWHGDDAAWGASFALAFAPVSIIYGQMFMLEASVVLLTLGMFWSLELYLVERRGWALLTMLASLAGLLLTKIYLLVLLPVVIATTVRFMRHGGSWIRGGNVLGWLVFAVIPAGLWLREVFAIAADPGLAPRVFFSLADSARTHVDSHGILASASFYTRLVTELIVRDLTPLGLLLSCGAFLTRDWRRHGVWLAVTGLLVLAMPRKFYEMNYYHLVTLPVLCVLVGLGWQAIRQRWTIPRWGIAVGAIVWIAWSVRFSLGPAYGVPPEDRFVTTAAAAVRARLPDDEPIATLHGSTLDLLYYCDRSGWALVVGDDLERQLNDVRTQGAKHLVVTGLELFDAHPAAVETLSKLRCLDNSDGYRIYALD
ncbi:MAG: glycosyltransferase family 39 protein [Planctomycetaceae bacterium]|nr:glycosyltransferase family 39 protein [Planctomycetaceae bacterium]